MSYRAHSVKRGGLFSIGDRRKDHVAEGWKSAWLKCYYPTAFYVGLLRNKPMGFYPRHVVVSDAIRYGLKVLLVDLRYSQATVTAEGQAIRLGLIDAKGLGQAQIETIEVERQRGPFRSLADLVRRAGLDRPYVEALVLAGALDHLSERRQLLWDLAEAYRLAKRPRELPLRSPDERAQLPPMDRTERLVTAYIVKVHNRISYAPIHYTINYQYNLTRLYLVRVCQTMLTCTSMTRARTRRCDLV